MTPDEAIKELREYFEKCRWISYGGEAGERGMACVLTLEQEIEKLKRERAPAPTL